MEIPTLTKKALQVLSGHPRGESLNLYVSHKFKLNKRDVRGLLADLERAGKIRYCSQRNSVKIL